mgnify:FL=1
MLAVVILLSLLLTLSACSPEEVDAAPSTGDSDGERVLTIGVFGMSNFEIYAGKFRRSAERDFSIKLINYRRGDTSEETAIARLNAELAAGEGPDIIDFDTLMSRDAYARSGFLRDMSDYFYSEFRLDDFFILDKLNRGEALYFLPSHFTIATAFGQPSVFGDKSSWTIADYERLSKLPQFAGDPADNRESFMTKLQESVIPRWVDLEGATCCFDNGEFAEALRFAKTLSDDPISLNALPETLVAEGDMLYCEAWIESPFEIRDIERTLGGPAAYVGFPTIDGTLGTMLFTYALTGVNVNTKNADLAWEFIRYLLAEDEMIYDKRAWFDIPLLKDAVRYKIEYMLDPYAEFAGKTITVNSDGTFEVDGVHQDLTYDPTPLITESQAETLYRLIDQAEFVYEYNAAVYNIIENAAQRYFSDACTLEEAEKEVQQRVSIYLSEQYG